MSTLNVKIDEDDTKNLFIGKSVYPPHLSNQNETNDMENNRPDDRDMSVADYEKLCLTDEWDINTTDTKINQDGAVSGAKRNRGSGKGKTPGTKSSGSKTRKKRRDSHQQSIASSVASEDITQSVQKSSKKSKSQKGGDIAQIEQNSHSKYDANYSTRPNSNPGTPKTGSAQKTGGELRVYSGSKLQLPSLVFTAAGSALDEDLDKGQGLHHISYNMDGLKDSPPVKFVDSPVNTPDCPDLDKAVLESARDKSDNIDEKADSLFIKSPDNSFIDAETDSKVEKKYENKSDKDACSSKTNSAAEKYGCGERRGSKSKRSKRKKSMPQCVHGLEDGVFPDLVKQEIAGCDFLQDPSITQDSGTRKRKSLSDNPTVTFYFKVCKKLGVLPLRKVIQQFGRAHMTFKNLTLTPRDMKALCLALQNEPLANSLDFTGNFIRAKELGYVISVLNRLHTIFQVSLCNNCLHSQGIADLSRFLLTNDFLTRLDISGNKLTDNDASHVTAILQKNTALKTLLLNHNEFREEGGILIGQALAQNTTLEDIDLSWNHLRRRGAIGIANGLQAANNLSQGSFRQIPEDPVTGKTQLSTSSQNTALRAVNLAWNGFGFEGSVAIGDMMCTNTTITELDLAYNRIGPAALLEILRGIAGNKTLRILKMGYNPVTASFSSLILLVVQKHRESALENIDLAGVVVDKEFVSLLEEIQKDRFFIVNYEVSLPVKKMSREEMREKIGLPSAYNVDPLRMLYLLKEKMRASDFFYKINKDNDDGLQRDELYELFEEAGLPVTTSVIDKIMEFMDTNGDGTIDLGEFLQGDKRIKSMSRKQLKDEQERRNKDGNFNKYSRTFQKQHIDPISLALKVEPTTAPARQSNRRPSKHDSDTEDNNHLKIP